MEIPTLQHALGKGAFATVYSAILDGNDVVVKVADPIPDDRLPYATKLERAITFVERGHAITRELKALNVVQAIGEKPYSRGKAVYEYVQGPSVHDFIYAPIHHSKMTRRDDAIVRGGEYLKEHISNCLAIISAVTLGLLESKENVIAHLDVKPGNVIVPMGRGAPLFSQAKIIDFDGAAVRSDDCAPRNRTAIYSAPELEYMYASERSDIFSLGATLCEMLTQMPSIHQNFVSVTLPTAVMYKPAYQRIDPQNKLNDLIVDMILDDCYSRISHEELLERIERIQL